MNAKKIVVLGDFGVGKTSLIRRYVLDAFSDHYRATLGVHLYKHVDALENDRGREEVSLVLWDIEGAPLPGQQTERYVAGASGALIVGDVAREDLFDPMAAAARMMEAKAPGRPLAFALNKTDLREDLDEADAAALADRFGASLVWTSAKTGENVKRAFRDLAAAILARKM